MKTETEELCQVMPQTSVSTHWLVQLVDKRLQRTLILFLCPLTNISYVDELVYSGYYDNSRMFGEKHSASWQLHNRRQVLLNTWSNQGSAGFGIDQVNTQTWHDTANMNRSLSNTETHRWWDKWYKLTRLGDGQERMFLNILNWTQQTI